MTAGDLLALAREARSVVETARGELSSTGTGPVVVSGMLAEQLAKELGAAADPGAVVVASEGRTLEAEVLVHVLAGEPTKADEALVRGGDRRGVPIVIVQLWPQADWAPPFVLTQFVVECRAGEGFPLREIADRIVAASERGPVLASRIPALAEAMSHRVVRRAMTRAALISVAGKGKGAARPLLALEQTRMLARLRATTTGGVDSGEMRGVAGAAVLVLSTGFALRGVARSAREVLPAPLVDTAVAVGGTWVLGKALRLLETRIPSD